MNTRDRPASAFTMRSRPEDFVVIEEPLYPASGEGKHTFTLVEKRGRTTEQVARELARAANVAARDVGYAGRKDRHAVTQQWFSLPDVDPARAMDFVLEGARVLDARRHGNKLRTGHLRANCFEIALRGEAPLDLDAIEQRVAELLRRGMPNRYGDQRFGREGDNAVRARRMIAGESGPRDRRAARFLISALQSEVFNAVLAERIDAHDRVELGDLARVEESGGLFWVDDLERDLARAADFEISATGPIFGRKMRRPSGAVAELEQRVYDRFGLPPLGELSLPRGVRALGTRRPLRVRPRDLEVEPLLSAAARPATGGLRVRCTLPPGAYVTVLLEELVGPVRDASHARGSTDTGETARVSSVESGMRPENETENPSG